jgi:hypothetical protein
VVVVDAPTGEVTPGLIEVGLHGDVGRSQLDEQEVELTAGDRDRIVGARVGVVFDVEVIGEAAEREETGAQHEGRLGRRSPIERRGHDGRRIEDATGGDDPVAFLDRRAEEHERRLGGV